MSFYLLLFDSGFGLIMLFLVFLFSLIFALLSDFVNISFFAVFTDISGPLFKFLLYFFVLACHNGVIWIRA